MNTFSTMGILRRGIGLAAVLTCSALMPAQAASFRSITMDQAIDRSEMIVEGRVTALEVFTKGPASAAAAASSEPVSQAGLPPFEAADSRKSEASVTAKPIAVTGIPGNGMRFTRVTLQTIDTLMGSASSTEEFVIAGGTLDGITTMVPGLPSLKKGDHVIAFLRKGYAGMGDPFVGVNQGLYRVLEGSTPASERVVNVFGDVVTGIGAKRVTVMPGSLGDGREARVSDHERPSDLGAPVPDSPLPLAEGSARQDLSAVPTRPLSAAEFSSRVRDLISARRAAIGK